MSSGQDREWGFFSKRVLYISTYIPDFDLEMRMDIVHEFADIYTEIPIYCCSCVLGTGPFMGYKYRAFDIYDNLTITKSVINLKYNPKNAPCAIPYRYNGFITRNFLSHISYTYNLYSHRKFPIESRWCITTMRNCALNFKCEICNENTDPTHVKKYHKKLRIQ